MILVRDILELFEELEEVALYDYRTGETVTGAVRDFTEDEEWDYALGCEVELLDYDWSNSRLCINYTTEED